MRVYSAQLRNGNVRLEVASKAFVVFQDVNQFREFALECLRQADELQRKEGKR